MSRNNYSGSMDRAARLCLWPSSPPLLWLRPTDVRRLAEIGDQRFIRLGGLYDELAQHCVLVDQETERVVFGGPALPNVRWINFVPRHHMWVVATSERGFVRSSQHFGNLLHFGTRETAGWPITTAFADLAPACVDEALR